MAISAPLAVADALESRLRPLRIPDLGVVDLELEFRPIPESSEHLTAALDGRLVVLGDRGEARYHDGEDVLSIQLVDGISARCEIGAGRLVVSTRGLTTEDVWWLSHPYFSLSLIEMLKRRQLYYLHAAGVEVEGTCVLVTGGSGSGKSTLALALALDGFGLLGDDAVFLTKGATGLELLAFPDEIDVSEETLRLLPDLGPRAQPVLRPGWPKLSFRGEGAFPGRMVERSRPSVLIFARVSGQERSVLSPMSRTDALHQLVPNIFLTEPKSSQAHLEAFVELVRTCECYTLSTGFDLQTIPRLIRSTVG